ncbi:MAG: glycosyltransferase family 39 protein [Nitriliruptoraceae bacterium]
MNPHRRLLGAFVLVGAVFTVLRLRAVTLPLWWDEAFTVQRYIREGPTTILSADAYVANNHVAFSFFTWLTTRLLGEGDVAVRLWALIPAIIAIVLIVRFLIVHVNASVGLIALTFVTTSTLWLSLSTQARGYGLVILAATIMLLTVVNNDRQPRLGHDLTFAFAGAVAILTFPPAVAVYLAHAGVWLLRRRRNRLRLVITTFVTGVATAVIYLPILPLLIERSDRVGSRFAEPIGWFSPLLAPLQIAGGPSFGFGTGVGFTQSTGPTYLLFGTELVFGTGTVTGIVAAILGVIGLIVVFVRVSSALGTHLVAGLGGSIVLLAPFGFHLADRYLAFVLVHSLIAITFGAATLLGVFGQSRNMSQTMVAAACVFAVVASLPVTWPSANVPIQAFRPAALDANEAHQDGATIITDHYHIGFRVYLPGIPVERAPDQATLETLVCDASGPRVYLKNPDVTTYSIPSCLRDQTPVTYRQQRAPGTIDVWYLPAVFAPETPRTR